MNKLKIAFIFIILLLMCAFYTISYANPEEQLKVSIRAGYDNTIRIFSECPVYIEIENTGEDFQGEIQIHVVTGYANKTNYVLPFEIPQGSKKEFFMSIPITTASRDLEIKIVQNNEVLLTKEHKFQKVISPKTTVVGVLSNEANRLRVLRNVNLLEKPVIDRNGFLMPKYPSVNPSTEGGKLPIEVVELNENNLPDNEGMLENFDFLILSNYDTSNLTQSQITAISNWVDKGNILIIGTGENARKVYSGLSEDLKPFKINGQKRIEMPEHFADFTERAILRQEMYISTGSVANGDIIIGDEDTPLAVNYKYGDGNIIILAFDVTTSPISYWPYVKDMWEGLLVYNRPVYYENTDNFTYGYSSYLSNIFDQDVFPFGLLCIIILVYIFLVGPVLYWILKYKDKRDYSWIVIPITAFLFVGIIYLGGYKTRFKASVISNYSIIRLDSESEKMNINSFFTIYNNNKRGTLKVECPSEYNFEFFTNSYYDDIYHGPNEDFYVTSKILFGEPNKYEEYGVSLWDSVRANTDFIREYNEKILLEDIEIKDEKLFGTVINNTSFSLEDSYIILDNLYISIGDIEPKSRKDFAIPLFGSEVNSNFEYFLNELFEKDVFHYWVDSDEERQRRRRREAHYIAYYNFIQMANKKRDLKGRQIIFVALNYDDIDYDLIVNGKKPDIYNINVIYTDKIIPYEKGEKIHLPKGTIKPVLENQQAFYKQDNMTYYFHNDIEAMFTFYILKGITVEEFKIDWTEPDYRDIYNRDGSESKLTNYDIYIKNNATGDWEKIDEIFKASAKAEDYINKNREINIKANITFDENLRRDAVLMMPQIEIKGVAN